LIELGYARRTREGHYQLSDMIKELAQGNDIVPEDLEKMRECVNALAESTGESGVIGILRHTRVAIAAQAQYQRSLMVNTREVYAGLSLFGSVTGRILFAGISPEERAVICRQTGFPGALWGNADSAEAVEVLCAEIRAEEIAVMENPATEIISFAVPVTYREQTLSLGLTMPLFRCTVPERKRIVKLLKDHAAALSSQFAV
jgi:DNA-binding IclR family transcriptional regulator